METLHDILRERLLTIAGVLEAPVIARPSLQELRKSVWSSDFEQKMRSRLIMGFYRYGPFHIQNRSTQAMLENIIYRAHVYLDDGNDEHLVDIANLCMKEYAVGKHPNKHFVSVDDGVHCAEIK